MTTPTKSVVNRDLILAARQGLIPVRESARLGGFGNMFRKELGQWWGTRTWLVQTIIWVLILNGISIIVALTEGPALDTFLPMSVGAVALGTVIAAQGTIVGEKQLGTAAWVMSKPASRAAFVLAKIVANAVGFWATALIIPSIIFVITMRMLLPDPLPLLPFLAGVGIAALSQLFFLTLTVMLGTFNNSRGPIAGVGIGFVMTGLLLKSLIPFPLLIVTPWPLGDVSAGLALGTALPPIWPVPVLATAFWIVVMTVAALWRFGREEF